MANTPITVDERLKHIAFIMDGNGRWAKKRGMPREYGHKCGAKTFRKIVTYCRDIGIEVVTVYAFSTENWKRSADEVGALMKLFEEYIGTALKDFKSYNVAIRFIGDKEAFGLQLRTKMEELERVTADHKKILNIALNYGGRSELINAFCRLASEGKREITEADINANLYTAGCPEPDLIVRTAGEKRLSNFLLWQSAYSELVFIDTLWPDMSEKDVDAVVTEFYSRKRRFGGV